jgi:transketolase
VNALDEAKTVKGQPTAIVAHTIKGKGVSFMENVVGWHGKAPSQDELAQAISELDAQEGE